MSGDAITRTIPGRRIAVNVFERIVCGVDPPDGAGLHALRQAARLLAPRGRLVAVTVYDPWSAVYAGSSYAAIVEQLAGEAESTYARARDELTGIGNSSARLVEGRPFDRILERALAEDATLIAVGTHGHRRLPGAVLGSVATRLLHAAPCPVLVARPVADLAAFPRTVVVGVDGSSASLDAVEVAADLSARLDADMRLIAAGRGPVDVEILRGFRDLEWNDEADPVTALVAASAEADLVVVGSRGLHGLKALGSVSERVAHRAASSVLVVRPPVLENRPHRAFERMPAGVAR